MLLPRNGLKSDAPANKFFGMIRRQERWGLTRRGWLALLIIMLLTFWSVLKGIHPFLAVTKRVDAECLVMEGWVHIFAAQTTAKEFQTGHYQQVLVTGEPVFGTGKYDKDSNTEAWVGADLLLRAGLMEDQIVRIPRRQVDRDRTYGAALELKNWLQSHHLTVHSINVVTEDAHARRTRLLFQEALGPAVRVGIIAAQNPDYDPKKWWHYSEGVREIVGETIAYAYAKFLFWPPQGE